MSEKNKIDALDKKIGEYQNKINELSNERRKIIQEESDKYRYITSFVVKPEHIKLLKRMVVGWDDCEFGAPCIDCKRPYGNSDVVGDIAEILRKKTGNRNKDDFDWTEEFSDWASDLHKQMEVVLQICVFNNGVKEGKYVLEEDYSSEWKYVGVGEK